MEPDIEDVLRREIYQILDRVIVHTANLPWRSDSLTIPEASDMLIILAEEYGK